MDQKWNKPIIHPKPGPKILRTSFLKEILIFIYMGEDSSNLVGLNSRLCPGSLVMDLN